jgi:type I restriction enzyme R subunit
LPGPTEARTREELIDPALRRAGWDLEDRTQVGTEIPADQYDPAAWHRIAAQLRRQHGIPDVKLPKGICDYVLYLPNGDILAVVEAKRTTVDPRLAETQTEFYVTEIEKWQGFRPFAFMTNGREIHFWDVGRAPKREVQGFFSPADLRRLLDIRQQRIPLTSLQPKPEIIDRAYQLEAVRRISEAFEQRKKRRALLVMATGTGKTRVAMALADVFLRSNQGRRILFVADRDALVRQALSEGFEAFIPDEPCARIYSDSVEDVTGNRLFAVTLQTLSNVFRQFTPAAFDLIIFDEVHRSIFNKWNDVLQHFDGRMIGLTATPAAFINRNTFLEFECTDGLPTHLYARDDAIAEGYLVDFDLYAARTGFQRQGIRGVDLTEEQRNTLIEQGKDPDTIDFTGTDLERTVTNRGTLREQWQEIWDVCLKDRSGQLPGKTIVFAMTQEHALRLQSVFEEMFPQYPNLVRVITYKSEHKGMAIKAFKHQDMPRIAISVDMLETGVNVPEVINLVFMRPVHSQIKIEQMIGRGTRNHAACRYCDRLPNGRKEKFKIIDFWHNDFNKDPNQEQAETTPVLVKVFNTRLQLLEHFLDGQDGPQAQRVIADLRAQIARIPLDTYAVKKVYPTIEQAWDDSFWYYLTHTKLDFLRLHVGPLLRYAGGVDVAAATFTHKVERLKLQIQTGADPAHTVRSIAEDASRMPPFVYEDPARAEALRLCQSPHKLQAATVAQLNQVIEALADQMKHRQKYDALVELDLADPIEWRSYIILTERGEPVYEREYCERVQQRVFDLVADHPTVVALRRGEPVSDLQLLELERTLQVELGQGELQVNPANIRRAFAVRVGSLIEFLRPLLELEGIPDYADIVHRQFEAYIQHHDFDTNQVLFLRTMRDVFKEKRRLEMVDLYEEPFTALGSEVADKWFAEDQLQDILAFAKKLTVAPNA